MTLNNKKGVLNMITQMTLYQRFYLAVRLGNASKAMQYFIEAMENDRENIVDYFIVLWKRYEQ